MLLKPIKLVVAHSAALRRAVSRPPSDPQRCLVPALYVPLSSFPLSPSGKTDREKLPDPAAATADTERGFVKPRNSVERALAGLWTEILHLERVGVHDDFFELGGDSMTASQLMIGVDVSEKKADFTAEIALSPRIQVGRAHIIDAGSTNGVKCRVGVP